MLNIIVIAILVAVAAVLIYAATKPDMFRIARSIVIDAAPEKIFPLINDLRAWDAWTPYNKDPAMQKTFSAGTVGVGASTAWDGNREVGKGSIEITASMPSSKIVFELRMLKPFAANNIVEFTLEAKGGATEVTWAMSGFQPYFAKVMGTLINCDKMAGGDFEKGLASLKTLAEKNRPVGA